MIQFKGSSNFKPSSYLPGGHLQTLARKYHSGATEDLHEVLENLARQHGERKFALVGYSLGANVLLKWLGENQSSPWVERAIAISTPFSLSRCSEAMQKGLSKLYGQFFLRRLVADMNLKTRHFLDKVRQPSANSEPG